MSQAELRTPITLRSDINLCTLKSSSRFGRGVPAASADLVGSMPKISRQRTKCERAYEAAFIEKWLTPEPCE